MKRVTLATSCREYELTRKDLLTQDLTEFCFDDFKLDYIDIPDEVDTAVISIRLTDRDFSRITIDTNYFKDNTIYIQFGKSQYNEWEFDNIEVFTLG